MYPQNKHPHGKSVGKYVMVNRVKYLPVSDIRIAGNEEKSV